MRTRLFSARVRRAVIALAASFVSVFVLTAARFSDGSASASPSNPARGRPSIILVTLDTVRADRMGFLGSRLGLTPRLDALAKRGVVFSRAYAQAPMTTVSHATLLTGTYPQFHGVDDFGVPLPAAVPYLPDLLRNEGYDTAAFVGSLILEPHGGPAVGFDRGFETYDAGFHARAGSEDRYRSLERRGGEVVDRARTWLERRSGSPLFLWVHLFDAHAPYDPPRDFAARYRSAPYDGEIAYVDQAVGRLLDTLEAKGLLETAMVVIAADHGEGLGDHGEDTHGVFLYDATIHVPLIMKFPEGRFAGRVEKGRVGLVDVAPTLLAAAGLGRPSGMQGESLLGPLESGSLRDRVSFAETTYPRRAFGWSALRSWRTEELLFVRAPRPEMYDTASDPGARRDVSATRRDDLRRVALQEEAFVKRTTQVAPAGGPSKPASSVSQLMSLGYVGGKSAPATGADPKDKIAVANAVHAAMTALEGGETAKALSLLEPVTASDPQIPLAQLEQGIALSRLG